MCGVLDLCRHLGDDVSQGGFGVGNVLSFDEEPELVGTA